jgi:hypothetical protein
VASAYRFYVIGDDYRILANEVETFAADADAIGHGTSYLATVASATAVEIWERARLVHRIERS